MLNKLNLNKMKVSDLNNKEIANKVSTLIASTKKQMVVLLLQVLQKTRLITR